MTLQNLRPLTVPAAVLGVALVLGGRLAGPTVHAQVNGSGYPPPIVSMTVLDHGTDTHKLVLAPRTFQQPDCAIPRSPVPDGRCPINEFAALGEISDEMQTIFAPGTLGDNSDYLFWVSAHNQFLVAGQLQNTANGALVLSGGGGPDKDGWWTLNFPHTDRYGRYPTGWGPVFLPVTGGTCLAVSSQTAPNQDDTFDLNYAAPGTVVSDPTTPGRLFMVYEGANVCAGQGTGGNPNQNAYISVGVATSLDYGHTWPVYRSANQQTLPGVLHQWPLPEEPTGAFGPLVSEGNHLKRSAPLDYGRYPILSPKLSIVTAAARQNPLGADMGDGEPSAFLDDVAPGTPYLYVVHGYKPGDSSLHQPQIADGRSSDLMLASAPITGSGVLSFLKWWAPTGGTGGFSQPGTDLTLGGGGLETPILADGAYENCGDPVNQSRHMASIRYVDETKQYLLMFVCDSPSDPATTDLNYANTCQAQDAQSPACGAGHSWFFATSYNPADPSQWSEPMPVTGQTQPRQIEGSWSKDDAGFSCNGIGPGGFKGQYPTLMSLGRKSGHLSTSGYTFYMWGCTGGGEPRLYASRQFHIVTTDITAPVTTASVSGPAGLNGWYTGPTVVTFSATDDMSGVAETESSLDNGRTWVVGASRTLRADGVHVLLYRSIDVDGNIEAAQSLTVMIDSTPPVTTATSTDIQASATTPAFLEVRLIARDNESGIADTRYSLDDGVTWIRWTSDAPLRFGAGVHTVLFYSTDRAGNVERTQSATFVVLLNPGCARAGCGGA